MSPDSPACSIWIGFCLAVRPILWARRCCGVPTAPVAKHRQYFVRASYIAETMDQLRNQTALTLDAPPAIAPVFIPGCSIRDVTFDCAFLDFVEVARRAMDPLAADRTN